MTPNDSPERFARPSMALAMAVLVVAAFGWNVLVAPQIRTAMALLGAAFLGVGTAGWLWAEQRGPRAIVAWFVVLDILAIAALWLTHLAAFLIAMPLIGLPVVYGGLRWGIAKTAFFLGFAVACSVYWGGSPVEVYEQSTGFLPGAVFVIVTGLLIERERGARQQIRRYAAEVEELATIRERNRIARDIHDSVGHYLTVVNVQIEAARATVAAAPDAALECLSRAQELAREGLAELRRSVAMLRTAAVEERPFRVALAELVEEQRHHGLDTELIVHGTPRPLPPALEFTLFRAAQEALTNIMRHASATRARCTLAYTDAGVTLEIADDGVGTAAPESGFGLTGLRERVQLVGGEVRITTAPGRGFTLEVRVPT